MRSRHGEPVRRCTKASVEPFPSEALLDHGVEWSLRVPGTDQSAAQLDEGPQRSAHRCLLVPDPLPAGVHRRAERPADDAVVRLDHGVGQERLPLGRTHRQNGNAAIVREFAQSVGEVALPLAAQARDSMRGNALEETVRYSQSAHILQAVQQPVGVCGVVSGFELPEPYEARHALVDRLLEQGLQAMAQLRRHPLGDARLDTAFRVYERIGAQPLDRCRRGQDGPGTMALVDEPAHEVLVRRTPWATD